MKFINKRLSALLLALVLAILPLCLAAPVSAAEIYNFSNLSGFYYNPDVVDFVAGGFPLENNYVRQYDATGSGSVGTHISAQIGQFDLSSFDSGAGFNLEFELPIYSLTSSLDHDLGLTYIYLELCSFVSSTQYSSLRCKFYSDGSCIVEPSDFHLQYSMDTLFESYSFTYDFVGGTYLFSLSGLLNDLPLSFIKLYCSSTNLYEYGTRVYEVNFDYAFNSVNSLRFSSGSLNPPSLDGNDSVLSVFSGVSSWLAAAIVSLCSMFFANGQLTVLGILAVCSLGLAVIFLIMYVITGSLRFK